MVRTLAAALLLSIAATAAGAPNSRATRSAATATRSRTKHAAASVKLSRVTRALVDAARGDETYSYESGIAPDDAGAVQGYLRRSGYSRPVIVRVPGRAGRFLVSDLAREGGADAGRCLILLENERGQIRELARTGGTGETYNLRPVVFRGGGRTIVLADMATEYTWGVKVYEIADTDIVELGEIDAAVPAEGGAAEADPTPFAQVRLEGGQIAVRFDSDLTLSPGEDGAEVARKPVVFQQRGSGFSRVQGVAKARPGK